MLLTSGKRKSHSRAGLMKGAMKPPLACTRKYGRGSGHGGLVHLDGKVGQYLSQ